MCGIGRRRPPEGLVGDPGGRFAQKRSGPFLPVVESLAKKEGRRGGFKLNPPGRRISSYISFSVQFRHRYSSPDRL